MGLENSNRQYVGIKEGRFVTKKDGQTFTHDSLRGVLTDVFVKVDGTYGSELLVTLRDNGEDYVVQMLMRSGYAKAFMSVAPNIALAEEIVLVPVAKNNTAKQRTDYSMYINQHGSGLKWHYTRDNPNGLPDAVPCKIKDEKTGEMKDSWDFSAQQNFFSQKMYELRSLLPGRKLTESRENTATAQGEPPAGAEDDLPF
jgi:hypothetical protein